MQIKVEIPNLKRMQKAMSEAPQDMYREANTAIHSSIYKIEQQAIQESPIDTGRLRGSIHQGIVWGPLYGAVGPTVKYAYWVHEGTDPHIISVRNKKVLYSRKRGIFFGKRVRHPGTKKNQFMIRARDQSQNEINKFFKDALERVVNNIARRSK